MDNHGVVSLSQVIVTASAMFQAANSSNVQWVLETDQNHKLIQ